jgi:hypothetical protein
MQQIVITLVLTAIQVRVVSLVILGRGYLNVSVRWEVVQGKITLRGVKKQACLFKWWNGDNRGKRYTTIIC